MIERGNRSAQRDERRERIRHRMRELVNVREGRASYQQIDKRIHADSSIDGIHLFQLIGAMIIASIGLNLDSTEAIVGAMLICPIMGSVMGISHSIATLDTRQLKKVMVGLAIQVGVCIITSTLYFIISPLSTTTSALLTNSMPTIWDVIIAFVGGFVGALAISRQQEPGVVLAGVAVATALMPPLCAVGSGIASLDLVLGGSALYEFLINIMFIAFGAEIVFVFLLKVPLETDLDGNGVVTEQEQAEAEERSRKLRRRLIIGSLLFAIPCWLYSWMLVVGTSKGVFG